MYNFRFKPVFILPLLLVLTSCWTNDLKKYYGRPGYFTPRPPRMGKLPDGDDNYSQGVRDGCNTALSVIGVGMISATYDDIYYDYDRFNDPEYSKGRNVGGNYCTQYTDPEPF